MSERNCFSVKGRTYKGEERIIRCKYEHCIGVSLRTQSISGALPSSWLLEFHILHSMEETDGWYLNGIDYYLEGQSGLAYQDIKEAEGCIMQ